MIQFPGTLIKAWFLFAWDVAVTVAVALRGGYRSTMMCFFFFSIG